MSAVRLNVKAPFYFGHCGHSYRLSFVNSSIILPKIDIQLFTERERERDRQRHTHREGQTDRQTETERERERKNQGANV